MAGNLDNGQRDTKLLDDLVLAAEIRASEILGDRDLFDLSEFSYDIHVLMTDRRYMKTIRELVSGFIIKKEDLQSTFGTPKQSEMDRFVQFTTLIAHRMHMGQARDNKKPYLFHPCRLNQILAETLGDRKISYISTAVNNLHDIYESQEIDFPTRQPGSRFLGEGMQIPLEMYNFVRNDRKVKNKPYFYRGINSIFWITVGLTKPRDKSYISYLYNIFYPREGHDSDLLLTLKDMRMATSDDDMGSFEERIRSISDNMGKIFMVDDNEQLVMDYLSEVERKFYWTHSQAVLVKKHTRRSIIPKLCDFISNEEDVRDPMTDGAYQYVYALNIRTYRYFKGFVMAHATFEKYSKQAFGEREEYGKIIPLAKRLLDTLIDHSSEDLTIIRQFLNRKFINNVHSELLRYRDTPLYHRLTSPREDSSRFAGIFIRYLRMLEYESERRLAQGNYEQIYTDMLLLNSKFRDFKVNFQAYDAMLEDPQYERNMNTDMIRGFSLLNMKHMTEKFRSDGYQKV